MTVLEQAIADAWVTKIKAACRLAMGIEVDDNVARLMLSDLSRFDVITNAPRDGTPVDLWSADGGLDHAYWRNGQWWAADETGWIIDEPTHYRLPLPVEVPE